MKLCTRVVLQLAALFLALGVSALASSDGYLYVVHGIPGRDIADNVNPGFPVDVLVDGNCLTRGLAFDSTSGPLTFAPGTYDIQISEANSLAGCSNAPVINSSVKIAAGNSVSVVAALSGGQPTLLSFTDDLTPVTPGNARFDFAQAADAPTLQATLTQVGVKNPQTFSVTAAPGKQQEVTVPAGTYLVQVLAGDIAVLASQEISLPNQSATFAYAVGQAANSSVALATKTVRDVF